MITTVHDIDYIGKDLRSTLQNFSKNAKQGQTKLLKTGSDLIMGQLESKQCSKLNLVLQSEF